MRIAPTSLSLLVFVDVDECASPEANECDLNAICTNTEGSYVCRCRKGFTGDGENCTGKIKYFHVTYPFVSTTNDL